MGEPPTRTYPAPSITTEVEKPSRYVLCMRIHIHGHILMVSNFCNFVLGHLCIVLLCACTMKYLEKKLLPIHYIFAHLSDFSTPVISEQLQMCILHRRGDSNCLFRLAEPSYMVVSMHECMLIKFWESFSHQGPWRTISQRARLVQRDCGGLLSRS